MKTRQSVSVLLLAFFVLTSAVPVLLAGDGTTGDYVSGMGRNLGRGLWNVVSSPAEIPCTMKDDMAEQPVAGFFTGLGKGLAFMVRRIVVGVSEVATFVLPAEPTIPAVCR